MRAENRSGASLRTGSRLTVATDLDPPLLLLLLGALVGLGVAYDPALSRSLFAALLLSLLLYSLLARLPPSKGRAVAWGVLVVQGLAAWYFISQYAYLGYPAKIGIIHRLGQVTGRLAPNLVFFWPHPNAMATFLEGGIPLAVALALSSRRPLERVGAVLVGASLGYALLLTASRGAWVALVVTAFLTAALWARRRLPARVGLPLALAVLGLALAGLVVLFLLGPDRVPGLRSALARAASRFTLYANSLHLLRDYPLTGIGLGETFPLIYSYDVLLLQVPFLNYAHNLFLAVWLNHGLLGLLGLLWLLVAFLSLLGRGIREGASPLFWGASLGVVVLLLHGLTDAPQYVDGGWVMPPLYALLGLAVAAGPRRPATAKAGRRRLQMVLPGVLVLLLVILTWPFLRATYELNRGAVQEIQADLAPNLTEGEREGLRTAAADHYQAALRAWPEQTMAHRRLGLLALEAGEFEAAVVHLERAWRGDPTHPANRKGLGYAYLWAGRLDEAEPLLRTVPQVRQELETWAWWRAKQGQPRLADYARQMADRLR